MNTTLRRTGLAALALTLSTGVAACGSSSDSGSSSSGSSSSSSTPSASPSESASASESASPTSDKPFGSACSAVPASGSGSFQGMSTAPVATAASNNPVLKTLVAAVTAANLGDTLNSAKDITVFAPANDAFKKIPAAQLNALLKNKKQLTTVLTHHVVAGRLSPDQLAGTHKTLAGDTVTVKGSGEKFTVGSANANVICGNVQTANATVYIIDGVLTPGK